MTFPRNDLDIALMFFEESDGDLLLVLEKMSYMPYVKRILYRKLGDPDNTIGNVMKYGSRKVRFLSESNESSLVGWGNNQILFLIETWEDE